MRVVVGLGSNLGDRWATLDRALGGMRSLDDRAEASPVYETAPVGGPAGQGPYLNCVVVLDSDLPPLALLEHAHALEDAAGRIRIERNGPRTLDVDLLFVGDLVSDDPLLTLPHPRLHERAFVLAPLSDVALDLAGEDWAERLGGPEVVAQQIRKVGALLAKASPEWP